MTSLEYRLQAVGPILGGAVLYPTSFANEALRYFRDWAKEIPDEQLQGMFDPFFPPGRLTYVKSNFAKELSNQAIETAAHWVGKGPSPYTFVAFEHWHGAATRVGVSETAFHTGKTPSIS